MAIAFSLEDHQYMARAIRLAKKGHYTTSPNPRVGCVLVNAGKVIGEGFHFRAGEGHAEVNAIAQAKQNAPDLIKGATAYVTLEPCSHFGRTPPCAQTLIDHGIKKVIAAMVDPNPQVSGNGLKMLEERGIEAHSGLLSQEAEKLNVGFIKKMRKNLPYVRCKLASSLDGKTAMRSGESKWITSPQSREDVQRLRAQSCAIISGCDSVLFDNARMNVRWHELGDLKDCYIESTVRQPIRVVIDGQNRLKPNLALFKQESPVIIFTQSLEKQHQWPHFVKHVVVPTVENKVIQNTTKQKEGAQKKLDLKAILKYLSQAGMNDILIESGSNLAGAFIEQNLVDELILYQAPKLLGAEGKSLVDLPSITQLKDGKALALNSVTLVGSDIRIIATFQKD
ncbi:MAG: bifunctional diaminohydroxyphosphoribosylaminopyrimidine deaminase/5-amino-6-(5-phosphoribosylamino)uracil reductase RibD [Colwellia sp.]